MVEVVETVEVEREYSRVTWRGGPASLAPAGVTTIAVLTTFKWFNVQVQSAKRILINMKLSSHEEKFFSTIENIKKPKCGE